MGTFSSQIWSGMGCLILARARCSDARAALAGSALGAVSTAMGLASFGWWASRRRLLHRLDNLLMESHLLAVGVAILAASAPVYEQSLVAAWVMRCAWRLATFAGHADLLLPSVVTWGGVLFAILSLGGSGEMWRLVLGAGLVHTGLVLKMYDTTGRGAWGTAAFHYATAVGWATFWSWSQTLPM